MPDRVGRASARARAAPRPALRRPLRTAARAVWRALAPIWASSASRRTHPDLKGCPRKASGKRTSLTWPTRPLLRRPDPAHDMGPGLSTGRRSEHHRLGLVRNDPDQRPNGEAVSDQYERPRSTPARHDLLQLAEPDGSIWIPVRKESR